MAFPFVSQTGALRQRILVAIGSSGLVGLGMGCSSSTVQDPDSQDQLATVGPGEAGTQSSSPGGESPGGGMTASGGGGTAGQPTGAAGSTPSSPPQGGSGPVVVDAGPAERDGGSAMPVQDAGTVVECEFGGPLERACYSRASMEAKVRFGCGMVANDPVPTDEQVAAAFLDDGCLPPEMACDTCCNPAAAPGEPMGDGSCCYYHCAGACCGRPLMVAGESRVADPAERRDWLASLGGVAPRAPDLPAAVRARVADAWLQDALLEHASIASFARFSLELLSFGAPAELVEQAQQAALDEVAHARECFALAARYAGRAQGPAPLDVSGVQLAGSLRESLHAAFVEGCVGETQAAALASYALERATDPAARRVLSRIAEDEARHAELAWRYLAWGVQREPALRAQLEAALADAIASAPPEVPEVEPPALRESLHAHGRLTAAEQTALMARVLGDVVAPCLGALGGETLAA